jgi:hypothetical protein
MVKYLSDAFPAHNVLKQGNILSLLHFNFAAEYITRRVQDNHEGVEKNSLQQVLVYAADVNLLWENINTIQNNGKILLQASKENGL